MQVKEYKSPEEALKEVKDPIIRSAIEPLSDKVAVLEKVTEMIKNAETPEKDNSLYVIRSAEDVIKLIDIYIGYARKLGEIALGHCGVIPPEEVPEFDYRNDVIGRLLFRVNVLKGLYRREAEYRHLSDLYNLITCARNEIFDTIKSPYEGYGKKVLDIPTFKLLEKLMIIRDIAENYKAEEHESKQD